MAEERFVVHIDGVSISPAAKQQIEQAINAVVLAELAKIDTKGDLETTPLSEVKAYGGGPGGSTAGMVVRKID